MGIEENVSSDRTLPPKRLDSRVCRCTESKSEVHRPRIASMVRENVNLSPIVSGWSSGALESGVDLPEYDEPLATGCSRIRHMPMASPVYGQSMGRTTTDETCLRSRRKETLVEPMKENEGLGVSAKGSSALKWSE